MRAGSWLIASALVLGGRGAAHAEAGERGDPATIALQTVSGVAGAATLGGITYRLASLHCGFDCLASIVPTVLAGAVGMGGGVYLAGRLHDGTGTLLGTSLGTAGGIAGSVVVGLALAAVKPRHDAWYPLILIPVIVGPILGYHLSAESAPTPRLLSFAIGF